MAEWAFKPWQTRPSAYIQENFGLAIKPVFATVLLGSFQERAALDRSGQAAYAYHAAEFQRSDALNKGVLGMGKRMRLFAASERVVPFTELSRFLEDSGLEVSFTFDGGSENDWLQLDLSHLDGSGIALVERDPIPERADAVREVGERLGVYDDEVHRPASAAAWVLKQAEAVQTLYLIRVHTVIPEDPEGAQAIDLILNYLQARLGGLIHADDEGFYIQAPDPARNDAAERLLAKLHAEVGELAQTLIDEFFEGDVIDWQITWDSGMDRLGVTGWRRMAVVDGEEWILFVMDAGDPAHREAFLQGKVPLGVVPNGRRTNR